VPSSGDEERLYAFAGITEQTAAEKRAALNGVNLFFGAH
jgi:hypothetical protein